MRIAKRALAGLLILTVLTCALFVVSFADNVPEVDCADLLTYFDPLTSKAYVNDDFDDGTYDGEYRVTADDTDYTRIEITSGDAGSYLSLVTGPVSNRFAIGEMAYIADTTDVPDGRYALYVKCSVNAAYTARAIGKCSVECGYYIEAASVSEILDACPLCGAAVTKDASKAPAFSIYVGSDASALGQRLVTLDFSADTVVYYGGSTDVTVPYTLNENTDAWYDVEIVLLENDEYSFSVKSQATGATASAEAIAAPAVGVTGNIAFGYAYTAANRDTVINLDDVVVQSGEEYRALPAGELEAKIGAAVKDFIAILEKGTDTAKKLEAIETYTTIVDVYGFTTGNAEIAADMKTLDDMLFDVYYDMLKEAVDAIDKAADYQVRFDHVAAYTKVADKVEELISELELDDPKYAETLAAYSAECSELAVDKENTDKFIAYMEQLIKDGSNVFYTNDYETLKSFCENVQTNYPYNATYPGVESARDNHRIVLDKYTLYCAQSLAFVEAVNTAASTDPALILNVKLDAYEFATANFFSHDTFPGVADAIATLATLSDFAGIKAAAEDFINKLKVAEQSLYIDAQDDALAEAEAVMDLAHDDYVGVVAAKERCVALRAEISAKRVAAAEYIAAVAALEGKSGQALIDAVEAALEKQKTGNIPGIPGVTDANIALNNAHMAIETLRVYSEKFIVLVAAIDSADDLSDRYAAIKAAKAAEELADDSVSGVAAAKVKLAEAVSAYNTDTNGVNSAYASVVSQAGDLSGSTMNASDIVKLVIAFIKTLV